MTFKNNIENTFKADCIEVSIGTLTFYNLPITEVWQNGVLQYIVIPNYNKKDNITRIRHNIITVKYKDIVINPYFSGKEYLSDIAFAEIISHDNLKLSIEPSGFHPAIGNGHFMG